MLKDGGFETDAFSSDGVSPLDELADWIEPGSMP